jgi:ATP-dependent DNA helicase RecQ
MVAKVLDAGPAFCVTGQAQLLSPAPRAVSVDRVVDRAELRALSREHPDALGEARQQARFLCGLSSPALARARLGSSVLSGVLIDQRFGDVLDWCAAL